MNLTKTKQQESKQSKITKIKEIKTMQFSTKTILALSIMYASTIVVHGRLSAPKGLQVDGSTRQLATCLAEGDFCITDTDKCCVGECTWSAGIQSYRCPFTDGSTRQLANHEDGTTLNHRALRVDAEVMVQEEESQAQKPLRNRSDAEVMVKEEESQAQKPLRNKGDAEVMVKEETPTRQLAACLPERALCSHDNYNCCVGECQIEPGTGGFFSCQRN